MTKLMYKFLLDLCMMITQFPPFVFNCFNGGMWSFGPYACELYACLGGIFGMTSMYDFAKLIYHFKVFIMNRSKKQLLFSCTMAAISYDRYNVIVNGMSGTRMTTSKYNTVCLYLEHCIQLKSKRFNFTLKFRKSGPYRIILLGVCNCLEHSSFRWMGSLHSRRYPR